MKAWRRRADWQRAFPVLAVLVAIAACFAISSYHTWQGWQGVHRQLAPYAHRARPQEKREAAKPDAGPDVAASLAARNVQLLSWQQSVREGSRQTLVLTGTFADLLAWLNDWPAACPWGPARSSAGNGAKGAASSLSRSHRTERPGQPFIDSLALGMI